METKKEEIDWEQLGLTTDAELDQIDTNLRKSEEEGVKNILKYFDRIHDKLFTFNNILIAGFFALAKFLDNIAMYNIIIPIINLGILIVIEYRMMEKSRFESSVRSKSIREVEEHGLSINNTTRYSLIAIVSTSAVTCAFLYNLFI